jgi:hypothetical protein
MWIIIHLKEIFVGDGLYPMQVDSASWKIPGYENVLLHMKMHKDMDMQKQMMDAQTNDDAGWHDRQQAHQQAQTKLVHRLIVQANR